MTTSAPTDTTQRTSALLVLAGVLCLSVSAILVKVAGTDGPTTGFLRCAIALVVLVPLALRELRRVGALSLRGAALTAVAGLALGADYSAWAASIGMVGAGVATVLINVQFVALPLLALAIDREIPSRPFLVAAPVMIGGILLLAGFDRPQAGDAVVLGTVLGLAAGCGYAVYLYVTRRVARREPGPVLQPLAIATAAAALASAAVSPVSGGLHLERIDARAWITLVVLALVGQVVAWLLINRGTIALDPALTAALLLVQPVGALVLGALLLGERPSPLQLLGAVLVVGSVAVLQVGPGLVSRLGRRRGARPRRTPGSAPGP